MNAVDSGGAGSAGGGTQLELNLADAEAISACHDTAAVRVTSKADSVPTVDGGYAAGDLNLILAKVLATADDLALINEAAAEQVRQVSTLMTGTDADVAAAFGLGTNTGAPR